MRRYERDVLTQAFAPPRAQRKRAFLRGLPRKRCVTWNLLWTQLRYIRPWSWGVSLLVFLLALYVGEAGTERGLWWLSSLTPFLATALVTELARSAAWNMEELELATRFSLKTVVLGRLVLLGLCDLVVLWLLVLWLPGPAALLQLGLHLLLPYLASALLGLRLVRRLRDAEAFWAILAASCLVGCGVWAVEAWVRLPMPWWILAAGVLLFRTVREIGAVLKRSEEYVWNC